MYCPNITSMRRISKFELETRRGPILSDGNILANRREVKHNDIPRLEFARFNCYTCGQSKPVVGRRRVKLGFSARLVFECKGCGESR